MNIAARHPCDPRQNHLLAALPACEWARWQPHLEPIEMAPGQVLCNSGTASDFVYFPTTAIISLLCVTLEGGTSEIAVVGNDGVVGICLIMGGNTTPSEAVVQTAGHGYRIRSQRVKDEVGRAGPVLNLLLRYTQALIAHVTQTAACNRHHSIDQQLCRRLLLGLDRSPSDELVMTQEGAANLLGVRREGITAAAVRLQAAGVIRYHRGHISVLDRGRLEKRTCECYAAAKRESDRLLPTPRPVALSIAA